MATNETVTDILAEMRNKWAQCYFSEGTKRRDGEYSEYPSIDTGKLADRFEAAYKREINIREIIAGASIADALEADNAELRECLKEAADWACRDTDRDCSCCDCHGGPTPCICERWYKILEETK